MKKSIVSFIIVVVVIGSVAIIFNDNQKPQPQLAPEYLEHVSSIKKEVFDTQYGDLILLKSGRIYIVEKSNENELIYRASLGSDKSKAYSYNALSFFYKIDKIVKTTHPDHRKYSQIFILQNSPNREKNEQN